MRVEIEWRRDNKEILSEVSSLVFLGNVKSDGVRQIVFVHGLCKEVGELLAWGAYSWSLLPFDVDTRLAIERILLEAADAKWGPEQSGTIFTHVDPRITEIKLLGDISKLSRFKFLLDKDQVTLCGVEDCLLFIKVRGENKFGADGWGSEKKGLLFFGTEILYGTEVRDKLKFAIFGPFAALADNMLSSFRSQGRVAGALTLTPEAWERLAQERYLAQRDRGIKDIPRN